MAKFIRGRVVVVRDPKSGRHTHLQPGQRVPDHLSDLIRNNSVVELDSDAQSINPDEIPSLEEQQAASSGDSENGGSGGEGEGEEENEDDEDDLDSLTIPDLREVAAEEKIDLSGLSKKAEIIEAIEKHRGADV